MVKRLVVESVWGKTIKHRWLLCSQVLYSTRYYYVLDSIHCSDWFTHKQRCIIFVQLKFRKAIYARLALHQGCSQTGEFVKAAAICVVLSKDTLLLTCTTIHGSRMDTLLKLI